jgi:hypothetical protein
VHEKIPDNGQINRGRDVRLEERRTVDRLDPNDEQPENAPSPITRNREIGSNVSVSMEAALAQNFDRGRNRD